MFCRLIWAIVLYKLTDMEDEEHFQIIRRNHSTDLDSNLDYEMPIGFSRSLKALTSARLISQSVNEVLKLNTWWFTYWSNRGIPDIRFFRPLNKTWWNVAEHFCKQREVSLNEIKPIEKGVNCWYAVNMRSMSWASLRENQLALLDAKFVVEKCPLFFKSRALSNLSVIYIKMNDFDKALLYCEKALSIDEEEEKDATPVELKPYFPSIKHISSNNKGVALSHLEQARKAEKILQEAISTDADDTLANSRLNMAYCMFRQQRNDECVHYCDEALRILPMYPAAKLLKSYATQNQNLLNECINDAWEIGPYKTMFVHMLPEKPSGYIKS